MASMRERRSRFTRSAAVAVVICGLGILTGACGEDKTPAEVTQEELTKGLAAHRAGDLEGAQAAYEAALEISPQNPYALFNLGVIAQSRGDAAEAERYYRQAIAANPELAQARFNLATLLARGGKKEEARDLYLEVIEIEPEYAAAHLNLGFAYRDLGDEKKAERHFKKAVELDASLKSRIPATPEPAAEK